MRISLTDSQSNGFKKWSDAQQPKDQSSATDSEDQSAQVGNRPGRNGGGVMMQNGLGGAERRAVEALAQALYEKEDPAGISWAKRTQIVRDPWIMRARRQLNTPAQEPR